MLQNAHAFKGCPNFSCIYTHTYIYMNFFIYNVTIAWLLVQSLAPLTHISKCP